MELKSTLTVFNESDVEGKPGYVEGMRVKRIVGTNEHPTERITINRASFEPGAVSPFHWHPIEVFYFVISGRAFIRDIEGNKREMTPGSVLYAPPGIASSHEWEVIEKLELLAVRATADSEKLMQFTVDKSSKESSITLHDLIARGGEQFKSFY